MYKNKYIRPLLGLYLLTFSIMANATESIPKIIQTIKVDGKLDESVWANAKKIELQYETYPAENIPAKFKTTAYLYEDNDFLYVGFIAEDNEIDGLRASYRDRDDVSDEDLVGIKIDTFNDQRRTYNFFVNPLGIQEDSISDDILDRDDFSWDAIWYSAGVITDQGYSVELKIPFKALRFANNKDSKEWAIDLVRVAPKDFEYEFASSPLDRNINCNICQYKKYRGFANIDTGQNLEIIPYVIANQTESRDPASSEPWQGDSADFEAGVDLRWAVSDNSVLNATVNPDFSQVESDSAQLDVNTRFALFFDEQRPFFLDGADYFNTMLTVYYSRNIADPDAGIKYTSKLDNGTLGVLVARDNNTNIIVPDSQRSSLVFIDEESNSAVVRYAHDVSEDTLLGVTLTHRDSGDYSNDLISFDGKHQLTDTDVFRYQLIHTETDNSEALQNIFSRDVSESGSAYRLNYNHSDRDWSWFVSHNHFDKDFRADLGFLTRSGYRKTIVGGAHRWYGDETDFFSRIQLRGDWDTTVQYDGQKLETESEATLSFEGKGQSEIDIAFGTREVFFEEQWFNQDFLAISASYKPFADIRVGFEAAFSDDIDFLSEQARAGEVTEYDFFFDWQLTKHFNVFVEYVQQDFDLPQGNFFEQEVINSNLIYQFDEKSFLRFLFRYQDVSFTNDPDPLDNLGIDQNNQNVARQLLYVYKFDAKSVLYLGYSDNAIENDLIPTLRKDAKTLFAKFSYAFQL